MAGIGTGVPNKQFYDQQHNMIHIIGTQNAQKANRLGHPDHLKSERKRRLRYIRQSEGFRAMLKAMFSREKPE